jgi:hypothetical protein
MDEITAPHDVRKILLNAYLAMTGAALRARLNGDSEERDRFFQEACEIEARLNEMGVSYE